MNICKIYFTMMLRNAVRFALTAVVVAAAASCSDPLTLTLSVQLGRDGRNYSVRDDSLVARADSVRVELSGPGADTARWTVSRAGAGVITLLDSSGTGSGWVRWNHDGTLLGEGLYLDSLAIAVPGADGSPAVLVESLTVRAYPTAFITVRRAWRPGERDSVIARVRATRAFAFPYVGDISDDAASFIPADSAIEIVANPAFQARRQGRAGMLFSLRAKIPNGSWTIAGLRVRIVNANQANDTYTWLGYFFYNTADPTWKGFLIAVHGTAAAVNKVVNTPAFDAANAQSGAGGGELQASTTTFWEADGVGNPNRLRVTASSFTGATVTLTSGPFLGGTRTSGLMTGSLQQVVMTRAFGAGGDAADTTDIAVSNLPSYFYECNFPSPCTSAAVAAVVAARRARGTAYRNATGGWPPVGRFAR